MGARKVSYSLFIAQRAALVRTFLTEIFRPVSFLEDICECEYETGRGDRADFQSTE